MDMIELILGVFIVLFLIFSGNIWLRRLLTVLEPQFADLLFVFSTSAGVIFRGKINYLQVQYIHVVFVFALVDR